MTRTLLFFFIALSIVVLATAFGIAGYLLPVLALLLFGLSWMVALLRRWMWVSAIGLFAVYGFAVAGFWLRLSTSLLLVSAMAGFISWDLTSFLQRLLHSAPEDDVAGLERRHLLRLLLVALVGLVLSLGALYLPAKVSFGWSLLLVLLSVWGIGRVVNWLLRNG